MNFKIMCPYIILSFCISTIVIPIVILYCKKFKLYDKINSRKVHQGNIPRLGGVGFVFAFCISTILFYLNHEPSSYNKVLPLIVAGLIIFSFGVFDDIKEQRGIIKLLVQSLAAGILIFNGFRFTNIFGLHLTWSSYIITFCWIIGIVNSYNLIDGIDGLCGGLSFFAVCTIGILFLNKDQLISGICFILTGAILGFLIYNKPKAKIFMGDGGSQFLGFMIAVLPLLNTTSHFESQKLAMIGLLTAIPLFDTIAAMWRRTREHKSFFRADKAHLHHKLMNMGYHTPNILILLYSIQLFLCCDVLASVYIRDEWSVVAIVGGYAAMSLFFAIIHYTNRMVMDSKKPDFKNEIDEH